jgi:hypothetical protein
MSAVLYTGYIVKENMREILIWNNISVNNTFKIYGSL